MNDITSIHTLQGNKIYNGWTIEQGDYQRQNDNFVGRKGSILKRRKVIGIAAHGTSAILIMVIVILRTVSAL